MRQKVFSAWGQSNWTICIPLSHFCAHIFATFALSYWGFISYYPRGPIIGERGILPTSKLNETEGFQCLGQSNWTICIPLSHFCAHIFATFALSYWGAISYYPIGPIIGERGILPTSKMNETEGFECLGHQSWTILSILS